MNPSSSRNRNVDSEVEDLSDGEEELDPPVTYDNGCMESLQSLYSHKRKVQHQVVSRHHLLGQRERLPIANGAYEVRHQEESSSSLFEKLENSSFKYDVGKHGLKTKDNDFLHAWRGKENLDYSDNESISDEENAAPSHHSCLHGAKVQRSNRDFESGNPNEACTWSAVANEASELVRLYNKAHGSSSVSDCFESRRTSRGGKDKAKLKFSICSKSYAEELSRTHGMKDENDSSFEEGNECLTGQRFCIDSIKDNSMAELLDKAQEYKDKLPTDFVIHERVAIPPITELLEDLQRNDHSYEDTYHLLQQNVKAMQRKTKVGGKRTFTLGTRNLDGEDPSDFTSIGTGSADELDVDQSDCCLTSQKVKGQTMADLFQEAFSTAELNKSPCHTSIQSGSGYHGRLQQVLHTEKDRHLEFMKQTQTGPKPNTMGASAGFDVQILSRVLEAKLTVCNCLLFENIESSQCVKEPQIPHGGTMKRTIFFSPKVCENVDLEVGSLIRIHPPWKEVQMKESEKIVLCSYCSQLTS